MKRPLLLLLMGLLALAPTPATAQDAERIQRVELTAQQALQRLAQPEADAEAAQAPADGAEAAEPEADNADTDATTGRPTPAPRPAADDADPVPPGTLRFHLMDGSILTGKLATDTLPVKTEFGDLVVPITAIFEMSPGLDAHPELDQRIKTLIEQLASPATEQRDRAQAELIGFGPGLVDELQRYADDPDAERKVRVATIIEELYSEEDEFMADAGPSVSLARLDRIVTEGFTVAGHIQQDTFNIQSKFGELVVNLADIKAAERITSQAPELRRSIDVLGSDMAGMNYKNTGIRLNRGDRVIINAQGRITMSPWGNNSVSGPDGMPQNGMYNGTIPLGGLAGRIGDGGEEFLVGSKNAFVAQRSGTLYLGFAMQQNWANYQFPGKYEVRVRVVPAE